MTAEQRAGARRERLLAAGLEVFATQGFHATKVRDICRAAELTERYFYESFTDKEALLAALGDSLVADLVDAAGPSIALLPGDVEGAIHGGARAVVASLTDDPRRAQILFVEVVGVSPAIEQRRRELIGTLAELIGTLSDLLGGDATAGRPPAARPIAVALIARALIGSVQELLITFVRDELDLDQELLVSSVEGLLAHAHTALLSTAPQVERTAP